MLEFSSFWVINLGGLSAHDILLTSQCKTQRFIVIAATCDMSRRILSTPQNFEPVAVDSMHKILEPGNWIFKEGRDHIEFRKGLNVLFTRKALAYVLMFLFCLLGFELETYAKFETSLLVREKQIA